MRREHLHQLGAKSLTDREVEEEIDGVIGEKGHDNEGIGEELGGVGVVVGVVKVAGRDEAVVDEGRELGDEVEAHAGQEDQVAVAVAPGAVGFLTGSHLADMAALVTADRQDDQEVDDHHGEELENGHGDL